MPITPYTGSFAKPQLMHLLRRTMFGLKQADLTFFAGKSMDEVVTTLLTAPPLTNPLNNYGPTFSPTDATSAYGQTWVNSPYDEALNYPRIESFISWWVGSMAYQERSIMWKMVMFWYNHLPVNFFNGMIDRAHESFQYVRHVQTYALGNFKEFIKVNAITYQMLDYLGGNQNTKDAPNENYGRELQELFTVGKDLSPHYSEDDVKAAARVMTGWTYNTSTLTPYFSAGDHDTGNKQFSAFYNNTLIAGRSGVTAGEQELTDLMNMVFAHTEVARYIVRKIYRYFVFYDITPDIETNVIGPLADTFRSSGYDIPTVMRSLLTSQHFYDAAQMGCLIKSPIDYILGLIRTFDAPTNLTDYYTSYRQFLDLHHTCVDNQMSINQIPSVAGWPAYYSAPSYHQLWINANTLRQRKLYVDRMTIGSGYYNSYKADVLTTATKCANPANADALIAELVGLALPLPVDATITAALKTILLSNNPADHYWTDAWNAYVGAPGNATYVSVVRNRLQLLVQTIMDMAESNLY
jgi:uncharacterized protein (DUF1800 family)